ncbi:hypothetical protein EV175_003235 [Coemansia sp. RSA 1933]|nr:hypothetical protein EV175_003235 [Coemansia sp. RSA 1933]
MGTYQAIDSGVFGVARMQNIQVLDIGIDDITFSDMLSLIKRLPNLTRLGASSTNMDTAMEHDIGRREAFVNDGYEMYHPLSSNFRLWIRETELPETMKRIALASVVIALLCPNFANTRVPGDMRATYLRELKAAIDSRPDDQHSETLEHLYKRSVLYSD